MFIVAGIIAFGVLIAVHELGHFTAARLLGVRVHEFAIGMGPKILKKQGKETLYTLRAFPLGGFCALGEDDAEETDDVRAFTNQKRWRRVVILAAGSAANLLLGFIIVVILSTRLTAGDIGGTTIKALSDGFPSSETGLMAGDTILSINGEQLYYIDDLALFMSLAGENGGTVDITVLRGGEKVNLHNLTLEKRIYPGGDVPKFGITFNTIEVNTWSRLKYACYTTANYVRLVRVSLQQLISGAAGLPDLSGPVGLVSEINRSASEVARRSSVLDAIATIANFTAFIAVNLAVMNLLPIPALDGGRILFIAITFIIEKLIRRRLDPKYEGYIHTAAFVLLMGLMVLVLVNDVVKIVGG